VTASEAKDIDSSDGKDHQLKGAGTETKDVAQAFHLESIRGINPPHFLDERINGILTYG